MTWDDGEGSPVPFALLWAMDVREARFWNEEAQRLGTSVDELTHMMALSNLSYQLRRRGLQAALCDEFDGIIAAWARDLGMDVVPRDAADLTSRQTFAPQEDDHDDSTGPD